MPGKGKPFEFGHKLAKGGARPGNGAKPSWWKEEVKRILKTSDGLKMVENALNGEAVDIYIHEGSVMRVPVKYKDIKDTVIDLARQVYGDSMKFVDEEGNAQKVVVILSAQEKGEKGIVE